MIAWSKIQVTGNRRTSEGEKIVTLVPHKMEGADLHRSFAIGARDAYALADAIRAAADYALGSEEQEKTIDVGLAETTSPKPGSFTYRKA